MMVHKTKKSHSKKISEILVKSGALRGFHVKVLLWVRPNTVYKGKNHNL